MKKRKEREREKKRKKTKKLIFAVTAGNNIQHVHQIVGYLLYLRKQVCPSESTHRRSRSILQGSEVSDHNHTVLYVTWFIITLTI